MRKFILVLFVLFNCLTGRAQSHFYEAQNISIHYLKYYNLADIILNSPTDISSSDSARLENFKLFLLDPFNPSLDKVEMERIHDIFLNTNILSLDGAAAPKSDGASTPLMGAVAAPISQFWDSSPELSPIGAGVSLTTNIIDATAQFLVERTKEELNLAFFDKLRTALKDQPELRALFPNTYSILKSQDYFQMPSMGETWIAAFKLDLKTTPKNLEIYLRSDPQYADLVNTEAFNAFSFGIKVSEMQQQGMHPFEIIKYMQPKYDNYDYMLDQSIYFMNLINMGLRDTVGNTWVSFDQIKGLNSEGIRFFCALILNEDAHSENLIPKPEGGEIQYLKSFEKQLLEFTHLLDFTEDILKTIESDTTLGQKKKDYVLYTQHLFQLVEWGIETGFMLSNNTDGYYQSKYFKEVRPIVENTLTSIQSFQNNEIGTGFLYAFRTTESLFNLDENLAEKESLKKFAFYGNFMVDITTADSSVAMKAILEKYAMPVGSYQVKRKSSFSVDLNAFPGLYLGYEADFKTSESESWVNGISAPIGFSFSKGIEGHSWSVFLSAVDIGAAFSYRWENDTAQGLPQDIRWEQIFSPGLHLVYGFKNMPISIMAGGQYTPLLREISNDQNVLRDFNAYRFGLTLSVDIPVFNLYRSGISKDE